MTLLAICTSLGGIQPSEFEQMDYLVARELAQRLVRQHNEEVEANAKLHVELTKAMLKGLGTRIG
jgi:hypothetical protein